jgi:hypothetical protein
LLLADAGDEGDEQVDDLDADERCDQATESVDQQVPGKGLLRGDGYLTPFRASGTRAMMIRALKITAERMAEAVWTGP